MPAKPISPLLLELIRRLKELRESKKQTLQEVYDATGVHIGRIESNRHNVTITTLAILCQHYQVTLSETLKDIEAQADTALKIKGSTASK
ncbi:helix-turn-helix domain-containing protein [Hymenobacter terricola]|uniref:helix-turn-helix domain-containing protein n=1 Tax=Hymenobacter terricola TaxID=2819236 RepID=UPI001B310E34|nr:helix-turn-helix transcriptional regulator [Hymenobacter terricola]